MLTALRTTKLTHRFRFFESRESPEDAPVILWLSGGPGCSSTSALLFELGPCSIANEGNDTIRNPYSWNNHANIIFLDQPVNVGFSYSEGDTVDNSETVGKDVYAFLELFFGRFPEYADAPFHIAAESYGGTYGPHIASAIHKANKDFAFAPIPGLREIHLASLMLGNGYTNPYIQYASIPDYACEGPYAVFDPDGAECKSLRQKVPICQRLIQTCYRTHSRFPCISAEVYCATQLMGPFQSMTFFHTS